MLREIPCRGHPLGLVGSMWAPTGAEKARQEIKKARRLCLHTLPASNTTASSYTPPPTHSSRPQTPRNTHAQTRLPFFLITVSRKRGGGEDNIVVTNGLKMSPTPLPFSLPNSQKSTHRIRSRVSPSRAAFTQSRRAQ